MQPARVAVTKKEPHRFAYEISLVFVFLIDFLDKSSRETDTCKMQVKNTCILQVSGYNSSGINQKSKKMKKKSSKPLARSTCPVACTLDIIGDKWTLLIVRDLLLGRSHFREFSASPEKIATNILSNRLARLADHELVEKYPSTETPGRDAYRLTKKGKSLGKVVKAMVEWGTNNIEGAKAQMKPK